MSFLRKHATQSANGQPVSPEDADFKLLYPALSEYLCCPTYPDGSPRRLSTLTLFRDEGLWKACLNEKDQQLVLFVSEARFENTFEALELLLKEDQPPWRKSNPPSNRGSKGKG